MVHSVTVQKQKSDAPLILGVIGFILYMPGMACTAACGAVMNAATEGSSGNWSVPIVIAWLLCAVLSFFGKSKYSKVTGILMILASIVLVIFAFITLNVIFGLASAICYLIAGILSCLNASRGPAPSGAAAAAHTLGAPLGQPAPAVAAPAHVNPQPGPQVPQQPLSGFTARAAPSPVQTTPHKPSTGISLVEKPAPVNRPPNPKTKKPDGPGKVRWR